MSKDYLRIGFNESKSKIFEKVLKSLQKIGEAEKSKRTLYSFKFSKEKYISKMKELKQIMSKCYSWNHLNIEVDGKRADGYEYHFALETYYRCASKCKEEKNKRAYCGDGGDPNSSGCRKIRGMVLEKPIDLRSELVHCFDEENWYCNIERIEGNQLIIDKDRIKNRILSNSEVTNATLCPFYEDTNVDEKLKFIPDALEYGSEKGWIFVDDLKIVESLSEVNMENMRAFTLVPWELAARLISSRKKENIKFSRYREEASVKDEEDQFVLEFMKEHYGDSKINSQRDAYLSSFLKDAEYSYSGGFLLENKIISKLELKIIKRNNLFNDYLEIVLSETNLKKNQYVLSCAIDYVGLYYSLENYNPKPVEVIFNRLIKDCGMIDGLPYGANGYFGLYEIPKEKRKHYREKHEIISDLISKMSAYYIFNSDWLGLKKHVLKFCSSMSSEQLKYMYQVLTKVGHAKTIDSYIFSKIIIGEEYCQPTRSESGLTNFNIDPVAEDFLRKKYKDFDQTILIREFESFIKKKPSSIRNLVKAVEEDNGYFIEEYFQFVLERESSAFPKGHMLSNGIRSIDINDTFFDLTRDFQNSIRKENGVPGIGEGWVSEYKLFENVKRWFPNYKVKHQWSPDWLGQQRIDIGIPEASIAIEYHGTQHYKPVEFFGGKEAFKKQQQRDLKKLRLCKENKVVMLEFNERHKDKEVKKKITTEINKYERKKKK